MEGYENYDILDEDPYLIEGSECLKNHLGFTDTRSLNEAEAQLSLITMAELVADPVPCTWDIEQLKGIHRRLFGDVYPFAGELRQSEIAKGQKLFLPYKLIKEKASSVFSALIAEDCLQGLEPKEFGLRAGYFMGQINMIHPFREGNGRTQRVLINQLADLNGYVIEWAGISDMAMGEACREARTIDESAQKLCKMLSLYTSNRSQ